MTVGSRSTKMARGTLCPDPISLKNVELESEDMAAVLLPSTDRPSGWIPCSRQYSSQHELPIWTPAWPTWILIHSRCIATATYMHSLSLVMIQNTDHNKTLSKISQFWGNCNSPDLPMVCVMPRYLFNGIRFHFHLRHGNSPSSAYIHVYVYSSERHATDRQTDRQTDGLTDGQTPRLIL